MRWWALVTLVKHLESRRIDNQDSPLVSSLELGMTKISLPEDTSDSVHRGWGVQRCILEQDFVYIWTKSVKLKKQTNLNIKFGEVKRGQDKSNVITFPHISSNLCCFISDQLQNGKETLAPTESQQSNRDKIKAWMTFSQSAKEKKRLHFFFNEESRIVLYSWLWHQIWSQKTHLEQSNK